MEYLVSGGRRPSSGLNALPFAQQLGGLLVDSHIEIYLFDARTLCFLQVSEGARRNLGYTDAELRRMTPVDIKPEYDHEAFEAALRPLRDGSEELIQFETRHRRKDGSEYPVWVRVQFFANESPPVFLALLEDITIRRETEEALVRQGKALAEADARKNAFLATLGHELRSPVAAIQNALLAQRRSADADPATTAVFDLIGRQVKQISGLVNGLLDLSLISRGKVRLHQAPLSLAKLAESAVEAVRPAIEQRGQKLHAEIRDLDLCVQGDSTRLVQVFTNILSNASKYTPEGRQIWFCISRQPEGALIEVRDEGRGIREEDLPYIFEPFTQPRAAEHEPDGLGLGLGLSLAKGLVALHGGEISAASPGEGQGTTVRVRLPALPTAHSGERPH